MSEKTQDYEGLKHNIEYMNMTWKDYDDFEKKYGSDNNPDNYALRRSANTWFNVMGILVNRGFVSISLVESWIGFWVIGHWEKYGPYIREFRVRHGDPRLFVENEVLYSKVKEYRLRHFK